MGKQHLSRDQKRKAKLKQEAKRKAVVDVTPYEGRKYQADAWIPTVYATERAIYETIVLSRRTLSNATVESALVELVRRLRSGLPAAPGIDEAEIAYSQQYEHEFVIWNIREHWRRHFFDCGPVAVDDLIGILRTLLNSMEAHAFNTGSRRGYVDFLFKFMNGVPPKLERLAMFGGNARA